MRFAYLVHPHLGGTYGVFRHLRLGLAPLGIEVRWLGAGTGAHAALANPRWVADRAFGEAAGPAHGGDRELGLALLRAVARDGFDGVFINVLAARAEMNLARYLPDDVTRIMLVHNITLGTYAAARAVRGHVHATICVSPRIRQDLVQREGFDPARTFTIPNVVETPDVAARETLATGPLRVIYLGRIENAAKGVFLLPRILGGLDRGITLTVAGDGPDLSELRARCAPLGDRIRFVGAVSPEEVHGHYLEHDVFLMPSRFEGFGLALVEAMAAGCVPVATRLAGVTDMIVRDGEDGYLFPPDEVGAARRALAHLAADRDGLRRMSVAARAAARSRFSRPEMAGRYRMVIDLAHAATLPMPPLDPTRWSVPAGMRPGLRSLLPAPAKTFLRILRERMTA